MKTKLSILGLFLALSPAPLAQSQIPQGFNYQAVAREASGSSIVNTPLPVRITIQTDSLGGTILWQELHQDIVSNSLGMINLVVGRGARQSSSTLPSFSDIDWSVSLKFIKTEINYGGWKTMGVSRLWSVPYSLVAEELSGSVKKLTVTGETENMEEALFEVKNKTGQTVFAVYNEGVRIYVSDGDVKGVKGGFAVGGFGTDKAESTKYMFIGKDSVRIYLDNNPLTKGIKGGFAVGGYDLTKGTFQDYLDVSADSVRIYIDSNPDEKKVKGGFAVGGYDLTKGITGDYFNVSGRSDAEIINGEARVMWYPAKEAFLAGNVLVESKDSVGLNSWASGYKSKAIGNYSQALGYQAIARKDYSTAIGYQAIANKTNSFAFGQWALAKNEESYSFGRGAIAEGFRSFAFGSAGVDSIGQTTGVTHAVGDYSFAIGQGAKSSSTGAFAIGTKTVSSGNFATSLGYKAETSGNYATALGASSKGLGDYALAVGSGANALAKNAIAIDGYAGGENAIAIGPCSAIGTGSIAIGGTSLCYYPPFPQPPNCLYYRTSAEGMAAIAIGHGIKASGSYSMAIGFGGFGHLLPESGTESKGNYSFAAGNFAVSEGERSFSIGNYITALSGYETVIGRYNTTYTPQSTTDWNVSDRLFVIGNGTGNSARSNAVTVLKNGNVGIGESSPGRKLQVLQIARTDDYAAQFAHTGNSYRYHGIRIAAGAYASNSINTYMIMFSDGDLTSIGSVTLRNSTIYYNQTSDMRLKTKIEETKFKGIQTVLNMPVVDFAFNESPDAVHTGFLAQDIEKVVPEAVSEDDKGYLQLSLPTLIPVLTKAIQEQQQQIESQQQQIDKLKSLVNSLLSEK